MSIDIMSHDQAVSSHAAERYIVGELSGAERESFEGHYFDCPDCFEQISVDGRLMGEFLGHAREVLDPEPEKSWLAQMLADLRRPAPVFVSALLLCALGIGTYQQVQIADARKPRTEAHVFVPGTQKGASAAGNAFKTVSIPRKSALSLSVDFTPKGEYDSYQAQIITESGKVRYTVPLTVRPDDYSASIALPANTLEAGKYYVAIQGLPRNGSPVELATGAFELQYVD